MLAIRQHQTTTDVGNCGQWLYGSGGCSVVDNVVVVTRVLQANFARSGKCWARNIDERSLHELVLIKRLCKKLVLED